MARAHETVARLKQAGWTLACAESCTGGLLSGGITSVPGASDIFRGAVVSYANDVKRDLLGVPEANLSSDGAVSEACAAAMAAGARRLLRADCAVSVTGIAGPGGATPTKPVGLVFIAVASPAGVRVVRFVFAGDRDAVRAQAVDAAMELICQSVGRSGAAL